MLMFATLQVVGQLAILAYCGAFVGLVRYGLGRGSNPSDRQTDVYDLSPLHPQRLNLWLGLGALAAAVVLTTVWAISSVSW